MFNLPLVLAFGYLSISIVVMAV